MADASDVAGSLAVVQSAALGVLFMPDLSNVRKASAHDPAMVADVRVGEMAAGAVILGTGFLVSTMTDSPIPLFVGILAFGAIAVGYEAVLRGARPFERSERVSLNGSELIEPSIEGT